MTTVIETRDSHFRCPCGNLWVWSAGGAYRPESARTFRVWAEESVLGNYICDTCGQQFLIHPVGQPVPAHPRDGTNTVTVEGVRMEVGPEVLAAAVPVIAALSGMLGHVTARRKTKVETDKLLVETAQEVVAMLSGQLKEQEVRCSEHIETTTRESEARCEERLQEAGRKRDEQYRLLQERLVALERDRDEERAGREEDRQAYIASWESGRPLPQGEQ